MYIFHISSALWCTMYDLCYTMRRRAGGFILLNSDGFVVFLWDFHQKNIRLWNISLICLSMKLSYRPKYLQCFHGLVNYYILLPGLYMIGYGTRKNIFEFWMRNFKSRKFKWKQKHFQTQLRYLIERVAEFWINT